MTRRAWTRKTFASYQPKLNAPYVRARARAQNEALIKQVRQRAPLFETLASRVLKAASPSLLAMDDFSSKAQIVHARASLLLAIIIAIMTLIKLFARFTMSAFYENVIRWIPTVGTLRATCSARPVIWPFPRKFVVAAESRLRIHEVRSNRNCWTTAFWATDWPFELQSGLTPALSLTFDWGALVTDERSCDAHARI